ncbi:hypothetical protein ACFPFV_10115 [Salinicoccus siamensis]|uniref:hypothetical protein n=1 Tax=Salinicoccus siamensis TaxID=381830 RepID=UPI00360ED362
MTPRYHPDSRDLTRLQPEITARAVRVLARHISREYLNRSIMHVSAFHALSLNEYEKALSLAFN